MKSIDTKTDSIAGCCFYSIVDKYKADMSEREEGSRNCTSTCGYCLLIVRTSSRSKSRLLMYIINVCNNFSFSNKY